jgi:segregation and condensation protein B
MPTPEPPPAESKVSRAQPEEQQALSRLEAILFFAREPLNSRKLSQYANLADGTQARTLVRRLNERYDAAGRAFRVERVAGGYQLLTRRAFSPWLRRLAHVPHETRLSAPALETLAVIAYRQPVGRADIEAIRGVNCGEILRQLLERDLVRIAGRGLELGRPYLYATTKRFLELFGLNHTDDLPRASELRSAIVPSTDSPAAVGAAPPAEFCPPAIDEIGSESNLG